MKFLIVGIGKNNYNYRKIEGFYNAFSKLGSVEWVQNIFDAKSTNYDICFSELNINDLLTDQYKKFQIRKQIIWGTYQCDKLIQVANSLPHTVFVNLYKSDVLNPEISEAYIERFGKQYQMCPPEGVDLLQLRKDFNSIPNNLFLGYLPCCLSEPGKFSEEKIYDIAYFGTLCNRPIVSKILKKLSSKYKIISYDSSYGTHLNPEKCFDIYKNSKLTISEQVDPVILELPVRLGEATANGCKTFILENVPINQESDYIPNYESCFSEQEMLDKVENYLSNFNLAESQKLHNDFCSTYDRAVSFLTRI